MEHPKGITGLVPGVSVWTKQMIGACRRAPLSLSYSTIRMLAFDSPSRVRSGRIRDDDVQQPPLVPHTYFFFLSASQTSIIYLLFFFDRATIEL